MKWRLLLFCICLVISKNLNAQSLVLQNENIESTIFPPPGWRTENDISTISGNFSRIATSTATNPTPSSLSGGGSTCLMLNSFTSTTNDISYLISKPYDFSNCGIVNPSFSFWMYRDASANGINDKIEVYWNNTPTITGLVAINHASGVNYINRHIGSFPVVATAGWYKYTFSLPAGSYRKKKNYFVIRGVSSHGANIYIDKFECKTYPSAMGKSDVSFELVQQNISSTSQAATNQWILGVRCVVANTSGCGNLGALTQLTRVLPVKLDSLLFSTLGTTNTQDISNAKIYYTGGSPVFSTGYLSPFPTSGLIPNTTYPKANYGSVNNSVGSNLTFTNSSNECFFLEYDTTYFWLVYDISPTGIGGNILDAEFVKASVGGITNICPSPAGSSVSSIPTVNTIIGGVPIDIPYCIPVYYSGQTGNNVSSNYIASVSLVGANGTSINTTANSANLQNPNWPCYPNCPFTTHPPDYELRNSTCTLFQGASYSISLQVGTNANSNNIRAWIDYNHNGNFEFSESLGSINLSANGVATFPFTVPAAGFYGSTRLRVREVNGVTNPDPCLQYALGETEDFDVNIIPYCGTSYALWLGISDDWNSAINWCPSIPTINDDVVINKQLAVTVGSYYAPTIQNGVKAECKNITISADDTLNIISAVNAASTLKTKGSINNNGHIIVTSPSAPSIVTGSGTTLNYIMTPFIGKTYKEAQTQIIYTATELLSMGLLPNDQITSIQLKVNNNDLTVLTRTYHNFSISYANSSSIPNAFSTTNAIAGSFATVYTNASQNIVYGVNTITLASSIIWNGVDNIVLQYCYTNSGPTGSANNDFIEITQTTGRYSTLILGRLLTSVATTPSACSFTGVISNDITANGATTASNTINTLSEMRPNATFIINRSLVKPQIIVQGSFINNNGFTAGNSLFVMDSSITNYIGGSQPTTFYSFKMAKTTAGSSTPDNKRPIVLNQNITIQDTFYLSSGQMIMNGKTISMQDSRPSAFWRTQLTQASGTIPGVGDGFLISENSASVVNWNIGLFSSLEPRAIPFGNRVDTVNANITYIPLTITHRAGDMGVFSASTKYWPSNAPVTDPPTVTHLHEYNTSSSNASKTVDRYWMIGKTGPQNPATGFPVADITMRFTNAATPVSERPTTMTNLNRGLAQPWRAASSQWLRITANASLNTFTIPAGGVSANGTSITFTTSGTHDIVVGQSVSISGIVPSGYNISNAIVTSVTATTFTIGNITSLGVSTGGGTVTGAPAPGGLPYNQSQTTINYTQTYDQVNASCDSVQIANWDWPIAPIQGPPLNFPAAPIGDFTPWTIATNTAPIGNVVSQNERSFEESSLQTISLFPNPATNEVTIDLGESDAQMINVKCVNTIGQVVYQTEMMSQDAKLKINTSSFAEGLYIITLNNENIKNKMLKVMIER